ncbi:MAG: hypothetical protein H8D38_06145 [DPANN group archaeon]|nr:hypothetical protein [DPANN group archaeon]
MNFCPVCGKSTKETFCEEHKEVSFNYKDIVVRVCECKKYFYRNRWLPFQSLKTVSKKIASDAIKEKVSVSPLIDEDIAKKDFEVKVIYKGDEFLIPAKLQVERCPVCSKKGTEYFESTLQLRPKNKEILDFTAKQIEKNNDVFISKVEEQKDGWDIYLSSNKAALTIGKKLSKSFKGELKTSRRLFGRDRQKSKHLYRVTVCFRAD